MDTEATEARTAMEATSTDETAAADTVPSSETSREPKEIVSSSIRKETYADEPDESASTQAGSIAMAPFPASRQAYAETKKTAKESAAENTRRPSSSTYDTLLRIQANRINMKMRKARRASDSNTVTTVSTTPSSRNLDMPSYEESTQSAPPVLLEARVVVEPTLVHAEPVHVQVQARPGAQEEEYHLDSLELVDLEDPSQRDKQQERRDSTNSADTESKDSIALSRRWQYISAVILVIFLGWVAVYASGMAGGNKDSTPTTPTADNMTAPTASTPPPAIDLSLAANASFLPLFTQQTIAQDASSPQAKALVWVQQHPQYASMPVWRKRQLMVLATFYFSTGGEDSWSAWSKIDWLNASMPECQWSGDRKFHPNCTSKGTYQDLNLESDGLTGTLPPEISFFTDLKSLTLSDNLLSGPLPSQLGILVALTSLTLMANAALTGSIPTQAGLLTNLHAINLEQVRLTGPIPSELGALVALQDLNLFRNQLNGSIPSELGQMTSLTKLWLEENHLDGLVPTQLGLLTALTMLSLQENKLDGPIPDELGRLTNLVNLWLFENQLTGAFPDLEWEQFSHLETFYLYNNHIDGTIPSSLCSLVSLTSLRIECSVLSCSCEQCSCL